MPIVRSGGTLTAIGKADALAPPLTGPSYGPRFSPLLDETYACIYRSQPNVRTVVDFLARNIAQIALHAYRRVSDTDRQRLVDHEVITWLAHPNPATVRYRLMESMVLDFCIFWNSYWLKLRPQRGTGLGLVRLPAQRVQPYPYGALLPRGYEYWALDGRVYDLDIADVVHFNGYDPDNPIKGLSPLETLRQLLEEDAAASSYRRAYWANSARLEGVITRPAGAPRWSPEQKQAFREQWQARYAGSANAGQTAILEDGMAFTATSYNARDSELTTSRKLTREECARAYHIPLPMVGILEHATFSNIKEQHKQLYQDALGPYLEWFEEEIESQLLVEASDRANVYFEFNIAEKMKGSFEEQATSIMALVGRPVMTANEGRARLNLPAITNDPSADQLAAQQGGPAGTTPPPTEDPTVAELVTIEAPLPIAHMVRRAWGRQASRLEKVPEADRAGQFDPVRCAGELAADLAQWIGPRAATAYAERITADTVALLREGVEAFAADREVPPCPMLLS